MIRPRLTAVLLLFLCVPIALLIVIHDPALWPFALDPPILVVVAALFDAAMSVRGKRIAVATRAPATIFTGEAGDLILDITAPARHKGLRLEALPEMSGPVPRTDVQRIVVPPSGQQSLTLRLEPQRRGRITVAAVWLRWTGPLRLVESISRRPLDRTIDVTPNVRGVQKTGLRFIARDAMHGQKEQRTRGESSEFEALREYVPGLDHRAIDWKQSARHRKLLCKEFQTERNHHIVIAIDSGHLMQEPLRDLTRLDHAINAALHLAWVSLKCGDYVGLTAFDAAIRRYLPPSSGTATFTRLQTALAGLAYGPNETNFTLGLAEINTRLKRRALVVLFTDFVDTVSAELLIDSLGVMANRHAILFITLRDTAFEAIVDAPPVTFDRVAEAVIAHDFLQERAIVYERLKRLGISCLDTTVDALSVDLVNRYLDLKWEGKLG